MSSPSTNSEVSDRVNQVLPTTRMADEDKSTTQRPLRRPTALRPELLEADRIISDEERNGSDNGTSERPETSSHRYGSTPHEGSARGSRPSRRGSIVGPSRSPNAAAIEARNINNTNLFVRNLHVDVDQQELDQLFSTCGTIVSSAVMRNIHTGESLGTGFVRFSTHTEAKNALAELNGFKLRQKSIVLQWARKHDGAPVGEARRRIMKLFVRNIPLEITVAELTEVFAEHGPIHQVTIHKDTSPVADKSLERHIAFVIYAVEGAAERAANVIHNSKPFATCNGVPLMVKLAEDNHNRHDRSYGGNNSTSGFSGPHSHNNNFMHATAGGHPQRMSPSAAGVDMSGQPPSPYHPMALAGTGMAPVPLPYGHCCANPMAGYANTVSPVSPVALTGTPLYHRPSTLVSPAPSSGPLPSASTPLFGNSRCLRQGASRAAPMPTLSAPEHMPASPFATVTGSPTATAGRTPQVSFGNPASTPLSKTGVQSHARPRSFSTISGASNVTPTCFNRDSAVGFGGTGAPVALQPSSSQSSDSNSGNGVSVCSIPAPRSSMFAARTPASTINQASVAAKTPTKSGYRHDPYSLNQSSVFFAVADDGSHVLDNGTVSL